MSKSTCWLRPPEQWGSMENHGESVHPGHSLVVFDHQKQGCFWRKLCSVDYKKLEVYTTLYELIWRSWPWSMIQNMFFFAAHLGWWCHLHWQSQWAGVSSGNFRRLSEGHKLRKIVPGNAAFVAQSCWMWVAWAIIQGKLGKIEKMLKVRPNKLRMCTTNVYRWHNPSQSHIPYSSKNRFSKQWRMRIGPQYHPRHARVRTGCWQRHKSRRTTPKPAAFCMLLPVASEARCKMTQRNCTESPHKCQFLSNFPNGRRTL